MITGGTSALGSAFVREAVRSGAQVHFTFFRNQTLAEELTRLGAHAHPLDLNDMEALERFQREFRSAVKTLDVLVHNAAVTEDASLQNLTEEAWDWVMRVNLKAPYFLTKKLLSPLFKAKPGKIFFIVSQAALRGIFGASNYAASKAGLVALAKSVAQEYGRKGVLANCVNPGFMKSAMTERLPAEIFEKNIQASSLGRASDPAEVAKFLVYLSSDQMTQVTGQLFHYESRKT